MEENKKSKKGLVVVIVLLILIILGLVGYICYDKGLIFKTEKEVVKKEKKVKERELSVDSTLVQTLYNEVTTGQTEGWYVFWMYGNLNNGDDTKDFFSDKADENIKMQIVAHNIDKSKLVYDVDCAGLPNEVNDVGMNVCRWNSLVGTNDSETHFTKKYIESIYKKIYGSDAKLDTSAPVYMDVYHGVNYKYIPEKDAYYEYRIETGGTTGPGGYKVQLEKAIKKGSTIKLYEKVAKYGENNKAEEFTFVYTFEKDKKDIYKYVSRVKEK